MAQTFRLNGIADIYPTGTYFDPIQMYFPLFQCTELEFVEFIDLIYQGVLSKWIAHISCE